MEVKVALEIATSINAGSSLGKQALTLRGTLIVIGTTES